MRRKWQSKPDLQRFTFLLFVDDAVVDDGVDTGVVEQDVDLDVSLEDLEDLGDLGIASKLITEGIGNLGDDLGVSSFKGE